jgi:ornithine cyclodeaminase/alanine dehydrogenase-like protein (mu-crystallin family)
MSALAARWLARPGSRAMALIGNGAQSEFQAIAFAHLLGIDELRLFDTDPLASAKLEANLRQCDITADMRVMRATSTADAVRGADIVTTVTADKRRAVILSPEMIGRAHASTRSVAIAPEDRAAPRISACRCACGRGIRSAVAHRGGCSRCRPTSP